MNIELTSDKPEGRAVQKSMYHGWFSKLTRERNCLKFTDKREMRTTESALKTWAKRHVPGGTVLTTVAHSSDGLPRIWLMFPQVSTAWKPTPATFTNADPVPSMSRPRNRCAATEAKQG